MTAFAVTATLGAFGATWGWHYTPPRALETLAPVVTVLVVPEPPPAAKQPPRHWEWCVACDVHFDAQHPPRRWYGLCADCYHRVPEQDLAFYNSVTQRWRKCARTGFGKAENEALVWEEEPSPLQVMLLRLAERFGVSTCPGTEGTPCEGLARRLGEEPAVVSAAVRGKARLCELARHRLIRGALAWLAADDAHCAALASEWGDDEDDEDADPDDPRVIAVAAALRHELGRTG